MLMINVKRPDSDIRLKLIKSKLDDVEVITRGGRILDRYRYDLNNTDMSKILQYELFIIEDELHCAMKIIQRQILNEVISFD